MHLEIVLRALFGHSLNNKIHLRYIEADHILRVQSSASCKARPSQGFALFQKESSRMSEPQSRYRVFLSHNGRDKDFVELLAYKLKAAGVFPWFDKWELIPGNRWIRGLADGLDTANTCAVFIGPHNLGNWEAEEIDLAHTRAAIDSTFRVIPVLLPGVPDPFDPNSFPPFLTTRTWVDFRKGSEDQHAFHYLLCGIKGIAPGSELGSVASEGDQISAQDICPYRGLQVFNEQDAQFYFGRAADIQRLTEKLKVTRFLCVLGPSGSGKSSLVRAGLIPSLRGGDLPGSEMWQIVPTFPPGSAPLETLVLNFAKLSGADSSGLLGLLRDSERALHAAVRDFLQLPQQKNAGTQRVLLVVDQLEEVFTLCDKEAERSQFLANLLYAGSVPDGNCVVVVTMRADFYHKCAAYPEFATALAAQQSLISTMQYEGLVQAIQEPALCVGLEFEPGLVKTIADDVASQPGALPLLEHALLELWKRRKDGQLTLEAYIDAGRVQGAIAKRADAIYDSFNPEEQIVMQRIMLRLTQPGEGTEDTRRRATLGELITRTQDEAIVERVIATLTRPEHRLLTTDEQTGVRIVEVSHEALIRGWDRLRKWLDEDREGLRVHRRLSEAAKEWQEQKQPGTSDDGLLYRGLALARASDWRKRHEAELNEVEREFLKESEALKQRLEEEQREREQRELETAQRLAAAAQAQTALERKARVRQRYSILVLAGLVVMTSALSYYAYQQYKDSRSRELAATATRVLPDDPHLSILLAAEAIKISPTAQAELVLREALVKGYGIKNILRGHTGVVISATFTPDGKWIVTASADATARIWEAASGRLILELKNPTGVIISAAFSPDSKQIVTAGEDKTVRVWDAASGSMVLELKGHNDTVNSATFSPDGKQIVTAGVDKIVKVWDVASKRMVLELKGHTEVINSAAFSPDGKQIITASEDKTTRIWNATSGSMVFDMILTKGLASASFSPDGKQIVIAGGDGMVEVWELTGEHKTRALEGHTGVVYRAAFSPDGKQVVTASEDKTARIWDVASASMVLELKGHTGKVISAAFSPDGKQVVTASEDKTARVWEVASERTVIELKGHTAHVNSASFSPDGKRVVTTSGDRTARVWEAGSERMVLELGWFPTFATDATFSPDGKQVVTVSEEETAKVWDVTSGGMVLELKGHTRRVISAAFSPDGKRIVTASGDKTAKVWDAVSGRTLLELKGHTGDVSSAAFSADGKQVVTASYDSTAKVWDAASGSIVLDLKGHLDKVIGAAFSSDGKRIVTISLDETTRVWDTASGSLVVEIKEYGPYANSAAFSPDGKWIVTAASDRTARVWEAASGRLMLELRAHMGTVQSAAFSPDGKQIVTASSDEIARIFDCEELGDLDSLMKLAKRRVPRQPTDEERRLYLD